MQPGRGIADSYSHIAGGFFGRRLGLQLPHVRSARCIWARGGLDAFSDVVAGFDLREEEWVLCAN